MKQILSKIVNIFLVFSILTTLLPVNIYAEEIKMGIVKSNEGNGINLRSGAGTSYERVGGLEDGKIVTIVEEVLSTDNTADKCEKWYKITYSTGYAYACTNLIALIEIEENPDYNYEEELAKFPDSYKTYIESLRKIYPNAMFFAVKATNPNNGGNMNFETAVTNENVLGKSLIWDNYPNNTRNGLKNLDSYVLETASFSNSYSGGGKNWYAASYDTIAYYMDPRNFLNEERVFMFESQSYNPSLHTVSGVEAILSGSYMANATIDGTEKTFAQTIIEAAMYSKVSPYFLASRILQEVGTTRSGLVLGTYESYPEFNGYYNYYNIGAGGDNVVYNGLAKAKENGWDSEYKAIVYGSSWIGNNYINSGQDTGYFQKWDIQCSGRSSCFNHQYMQNIEAPNSEAYNTYKAYKKTFSDSMYLTPYVFTIPVYENMPEKTVLPSTKDPINYLSSLIIDKVALGGFDASIYEYNLTVPYETSTITIEANPSSSKAKVTGIGNVKVTGDKQDIVITVTSESGNIQTYTLHVTRDKKKEEPKVSLSDVISKVEGIKFEENTISGITSVDVIKEKFNSINSSVVVSVKNKDGVVVTNGNLGTGYKINLELNGEIKEYEMILYGDTNGDAEITIVDLLRIQKHLLKSIALAGVESTASDVNKDGSVTILDLLLIQKHLLGSKYISQ